MTDAAEPNWYLGLVLLEAERDLIDWMRDCNTLVLRALPGDRALGPADRQLACDILVVMRSGEDLEPPITDAYAIERPFTLTLGANLPPGYPRAAGAESYWTAKIHALPEMPAWHAVIQDATARADELSAVTPVDAPPAIWVAAAVRREAASSYEP